MKPRLKYVTNCSNHELVTKSSTVPDCSVFHTLAWEAVGQICFGFHLPFVNKPLHMSSTHLPYCFTCFIVSHQMQLGVIIIFLCMRDANRQLDYIANPKAKRGLHLFHNKQLKSMITKQDPDEQIQRRLPIWAQFYSHS